MKKIFLSIILSATFLLSSVPTFAAQPVYYYYYTYENPYFTYNGTAYETDMYACNGEVMIPLRTYAEIFDGSIAWFAPTQTVSLTIGDNYYEMSEGNNYIKINDTTGYLVMPPQIINDKLCVPFRQFSEITGNVVAFDIENRSFAMETAPKTVSIEKQTGTRLVSVNYKGDIIDGKYEIQRKGKLIGYAYYENGEEIKRTTAARASDTPEDNYIYIPVIYYPVFVPVPTY